MKKKSVCMLAVVVLLAVNSLLGHDMYLKFKSYFLAPNTDATVALINGTFGKSENVVTSDRMQDVSIVGPMDATVHPDTSQWWAKENTAWLNFRTGAPGTYVIGVSTRPRILELPSEDFNTYLEHDGLLDVLEARKREGRLDQNAREQYSKHVKAIYQVGDLRTAAYQRRLGYPVEIVPLQNPYDLSKEDTLEVLVLRESQPVANQLIYASHDGCHSHDDDDDGTHVEAVQTRTDEQGVARIALMDAGVWYIRLIHMVERPEPDVDYESNWATLTFEIR